MRINVCLLALLLITSTSFAKSSPKEFQDTKNNFSVKYPAKITPSKNFSTDYLASNSWSVAAAGTKMSSGQQAIVEFDLWNKDMETQEGKAAVKVLWRAAVSHNKKDIAECYQPANTTAKSEQKTRNMTFKQFVYSDAAMMKQINARIYRYQTDNACYSIEIINLLPDSDNERAKKIAHRKDKVAFYMLNSVKISA